MLAVDADHFGGNVRQRCWRSATRFEVVLSVELGRPHDDWDCVRRILPRTACELENSFQSFHVSLVKVSGGAKLDIRQSDPGETLKAIVYIRVDIERHLCGRKRRTVKAHL